MSEEETLDDISEQNSPYGNWGTRGKEGSKRHKGKRPFIPVTPKWKNQLRAFKFHARKRKENVK